MAELFLKILNMSISASWAILAVLLIRFAFRRGAKWMNVLLWGIVALRLICPTSVESVLSLIPSAETISPEIMMTKTPTIQTGISSVNHVMNPIIMKSFAPAPGDSANPLQIWIPVCSVIWVIGMIILLLYAAVSYLRLVRQIDTAVLMKGNIFQSESVDTPFVLGVVRPRIYLPFRMDERDLKYIIAHEQAHIRRKDHWWKPLGFLLLTVHWFNPLMWLAYVLLCRDIELACDEEVIKDLDREHRADYSQALLSQSVGRHRIAVCPLAFGEVGVKKRVISVMNYKKPESWVIAASVIACVVAAGCFLTNPRGAKIEDIIYEKGYTISKQVKTNITLSVSKKLLPDTIYTKGGHTFEENEVVAYQTDTSIIYLERIMLANEGDEYLYFIFNLSYNLPDSGSILLPYQRRGTKENPLFSPVIVPNSTKLIDKTRTFEDAVHLRGRGPKRQFVFYVATNACKLAEDTIQIEIICNKLTYVKNGSDEYNSVKIDAPLGMRMRLSGFQKKDTI